MNTSWSKHTITAFSLKYFITERQQRPETTVWDERVKHPSNLDVPKYIINKLNV